MSKYVVTLVEHQWEGSNVNLYVTEAENPKDAILKVVDFVNDERFDSTDKDWSVNKYNEQMTEQGYFVLSQANKYFDSDSLEFAAYPINESEPNVRHIITVD